MSTVRLHDLAIAGFSDALDGVAVVAEQGAGFDEFDGFFEAVAGGFDYADVVGIRGGGADVVGFV